MLHGRIMLRSITLGTLLTMIFVPSAYANNEKKWQQEVFREFEQLYRPVARSEGKSFKLSIEKNESSSGEAKTDDKNVEIVLNTGLLKNPTLTPDGLRMLICHELGHVFGGAPRKNVPPEWDGPSAKDGRSFASSEGQADYYASASCFHRVIRGSNHQKELTESKAQSRAQRQCDIRLGANSEESLICQRAAAGGNNMLQLNHVFSISYDTPDKTVAGKVIEDSYPERQCRLDTFLMGAVCRSDMPVVMYFNNAGANDCKDAYRPLCWYPIPIANRNHGDSTTASTTAAGGATQR